MGRASKSTKKFVASGKLKKAIHTRRKHQKIKKRIENRRGAKKPAMASESDVDGDSDDVGIQEKKVTRGLKNLSFENILDVHPKATENLETDEGEDNDRDLDSTGPASGDDDAEDDQADDQSFASVDDLDDDGKNHLLELSRLAEKDPEFFKYLQENDPELLGFDPDTIPEGGSDDELMDDGEAMEEDDVTPILTKQLVAKWQQALLKQHSLRALRRLLIAFRSAAHMNEEGQVLAWRFDNASVYNKVIMTALRYTPIVLEHHIPYKVLPNGKFKAPAQTPKFKTLQKLVLSYFQNIIHLLSQMTDNEMVALSVTESAKLVPYISSCRKAIRQYVKKCIELWSTAEDSVRIAALLAIRKLVTGDASIMDLVLKTMYLALVRSSKVTNAFNLPSINFMKNSAAEIFCIDHTTTYQHAFGYIRQLAIHLRNSMKVRTKEAYKLVYNWQYVHSVDFWTIVLARACSTEVALEKGQGELKALIYPLVQVSLGAIKLVSNARSYPFHLHIIRSLLHLSQHTNIYIPISPYILPVIISILTPSARPKPSTLRPLDFEVHIHPPQQYVKTRIYSENLLEEACFLLAEWLTSGVVHGSVAFPEVVVPVIVALRKALKASSKSEFSMVNESGIVKALVERIEESAQWMEQKRSTVTFTPGNTADVEDWESTMHGKLDQSPLGKYVKFLQKTREKRRKLIDKARKGEDEVLENR